MQICSSDILRMRTGGPVQLELLPLKPEMQSLRGRHSQEAATHDLTLWGVNYGVSGGGRARSFIDMNAMPSTSGDDGGDAGVCALQLSGGAGVNSAANGAGSPGLGKRERDKGPAESGDFYTATTEVTSRISDEEESGSSRKKLRLTKEQSALLEESFKEHSTLNPKQKNALAKQLNLRPRQVEVWFQNRRARTKLKQTEVDFEVLKKCFESLTEENRRLHKEVAELRALKVGAPCVISHDFYMPLPAATLTMCPSCERLAPKGVNSGAGVGSGAIGVSQNNSSTTTSALPDHFAAKTASSTHAAAAAARPSPYISH